MLPFIPCVAWTPGAGILQHASPTLQQYASPTLKHASRWRAQAAATMHIPVATSDAPRLVYADKIKQFSPSLKDSVHSLSHGELRDINALFSELTSYTNYLTGWPGNTAEAELRFALEVAYLAHRGQKRKSGEAFIIHPVQVASILAQSRMDLPSLTSGLLHDTVEDTALTFDEVETLFGHEVRNIVEGETKVSKLPKVVRAQLEEGVAGSNALGDDGLGSETMSKSDEQAENLRSMFVAMADDWRIVVVKLADRLHNMRTLEHMPPHKRISIARETLEIFTPLAHRLGMWSYKSELADLSFSYLFPEDHEELRSYISSKAKTHADTLAVAERKIKQQVAEDRWLSERVRRVVVEGRTKSIHSTWRKMQRRSCRVEEVHDLLAVRIILELNSEISESDDKFADISVCYAVLGRVHGTWTPMPRTVRAHHPMIARRSKRASQVPRPRPRPRPLPSLQPTPS
jgi:(p)ppGpp synthase/HD superfamily hydrolase